MSTYFSKTSNPEYSKFIALSRYARWSDEKQRRETWNETVDRYVSFFEEKLKDKNISKKDWDDIRNAILNLEVMPSMRCLMTAGKALERDNVAGFNCSYVAVDHPRAFDETMFILMCGTGVGFSVERQYVQKLPEVSEDFHHTNTVITVPDSKRGWAKSLKELISLLYTGHIPTWDLSNLRPAGARLKTFGGRSSGPDPLDDLFNFTVNLFTKAAGRKLSSIECHDLMCKIADVVVVGGVRRSALISLSNLSDDRMRDAKKGQFWLDEGQRQLANNSTCYTEKPEFSTFLKEMVALYESKTGERGIFNREASIHQALRNGRREEASFGTNPCCVAPETYIMTDKGVKMISELKDAPFIAVVNGQKYNAPRGSWISGEGEIYKLKTKAGYELLLTKEHQILTQNRGWVEAQNLTTDDDIVINSHADLDWEGVGTFEEGYLLGSFIGDGNFVQPKLGSNGEVKLWKHDLCETQLTKMEQYASKIPHRSDWNGWGDRTNHYRMSISKLPLQYGMDWKQKNVTKEIETASCKFQQGFLRGWFDADGHVETRIDRGCTVRLSSIHKENLIAAQRMLLRQGIKSRIYSGPKGGPKLLPDSKGGKALYNVHDLWILVISSSDLITFDKRIGFGHSRKSNTVKKIIGQVEFYSKPFITKFESLTFERVGEVWDAEVSDVHAFDANGIYAHNSEIILRPNQFCNLSEVVIRSTDSLDDLKRKVRIATIIGTMQSSLTDFDYLRSVWKKNTEEEALLGVSLTGIMDHVVTAGKTNPEELKIWLNEMKQIAIDTNKIYSKKIGVNVAAAITCVKPSGTVSQLVDSASGIHDRFSEYYIRTVRADNKDPLAMFMKEKGFPCEADVAKKDSGYVFSFPIKAPEGCSVATDRTALEQLNHWKIFQTEWCEHKPSVTIYYKEDEFFGICQWVWDNWDTVSGISFLPHSDHVYQQAPYQPISKEKYEMWVAKMPKGVDWTELAKFEKEDTTSGNQTLACSGTVCEMVDISQK